MFALPFRANFPKAGVHTKCGSQLNNRIEYDIFKVKKSTILSFRCVTPHEAQHQINCCVGVVLWSAIFLLRKINSAVISDDGTRLSVRCENTAAWLHLPRERTRTPFTYRTTHARARAADSTYLYSYSTHMGETC